MPMLGAGNSTIRRVDPSPPAVDRYGRAGAQTPDGSADADEEESQSEAEAHEGPTRRPAQTEVGDPGPALLPDRPVLRWLRMAPNARMRLSPAQTGALALSERKAARQKLAAYLGTTPKAAVAQRLEHAAPSHAAASPPAYETASASADVPPPSDIDLTG